MDATFERLSDHDIESEDVIDILIRSERSSSKSKQSDPDVKPGSPHNKGHKFYGVRRGRTPGIYSSWEECQTQVEGFSGCEFKSFRSKRDAIDYMEVVVRTDDSHQSESKKYYGVRRGRTPGIYRSWDDCQTQVEGFSGCEFQSFTQARDAHEYMASAMNMDENIPSIFPRSGGLSQENAKIAPLKSVDNKSQDKIKQVFKCPKFSGNTKDWKLWNKGFQRYLAIWDLAYVLSPNFFDDLPLTPEKVQDNKLVYFLLDDVIQASPLASSYLRQAPAENGFEAYYTLHDGFVFAASTASTILLNELANFRFLPDESPTGMIMRLDELLQDMEMLPDGASMTFNDTQRIGYLLGALRHEPEWATVASTITSSQLRGDMTFRSACDELKFRCEAERAYEVLDRGVKPKRKVTAMVSQIEPVLDAQSIETITTALVSSVGKRLNKEMAPATKDKGTRKKFNCLAKDGKTKSPFSLCGLHYHSVISGKTEQLELINDYGVAVYNVTTKMIDYPDTVPKDLLPPIKTKV
jgi:viroplasmin and RNaseH domain-containing protein